MKTTRGDRKRAKRRYEVLAAEFILIGGHKDWLPENNHGNLKLLRNRLEVLSRHLDGYMTRPAPMPRPRPPYHHNEGFYETKSQAGQAR